MKLLTIAPALAAVLALAGCSNSLGTTLNCTANGIEDHFTLLTSSASHPDPSLQICVQAACSEVIPNASDRSGRLTSTSSKLAIYPAKSGRWTLAVLNGQRPAELLIKLYTEHTQIATRAVALNWRRGDPSDTCHDWQTTGPIKVQAR